MRALIVGCGHVGTELGLRLARAGHQVWGLRRDPSGLPEGIGRVRADVLDPDLQDRLPPIDHVVYAVSADSSSRDRYRDAYVHGVENVLRALDSFDDPPSRFVFVSSTAVFGDAGGDWVDEQTEPEPDGFRGEEVLEGERLVRSSSIPGVCLRLGGMYGPGRSRLVEEARAGRLKCPSGGPSWSNRIHRNDAAGAAMKLLTAPDPHPVYIGVDDEPAPICDVYRYVAGLIGAPEPTVDPERERSRSNKRCSNRLLRVAGYQLEYPTYREGYGALVSEMDATSP